ncbi:hypothetical protein WKH56_07400 [Priestia sp. SB1]|uniref:hypothetical protein n=1 Tax=Priestia sp. SB1 TaxID=3132359 RepID=UPI00316B2D8F
MGKEKVKVLQLRITDSVDPKIAEWVNAQTLSSSDIIKFFIEFDIALNGGIRDMAEVITSKRTKGFMQSYINALVNKSNDEQIETIYDRDAGTVIRRVPAPTNQSTVHSSNNVEPVEEEKTNPVITRQVQEEVANSSQPSIQNKVQTPSVEELQAQIAQMQAQMKQNQAKEAPPVEEKITDSVTRTPAPKVDKEERVQSSNINSDENVDVKSVEAGNDKEPKEAKGNDLSALKKTFNVKEWM